MSALEQGVLVVEAYANSEREVGKAIQEAVSKAITQLNQEGKRVVNITAGPSVKYMLGVNHLTNILWEKDSGLKTAYRATESKASTGFRSQKEEPIDDSKYYDVIINSVGNDMLKIIREIRTINGMSLPDIKRTVENCPATITSHILGKNAKEIKANLESLGASIELRKNS